MRLGLDLTHTSTAAELLDRTVEADELGLWAVLVSGAPGTETLRAAELATATRHVHLAVLVHAEDCHPRTVAEELAVLDQLSQRRVVAIVDGPHTHRATVARLLHGHIVDGVALTPPPAQTQLPVWDAADVARVALTGDRELDAVTINAQRDAGITHLFAEWPRDGHTFARHLATRAVGPDFPQLVADMADIISPQR